ncbi:MAG: hypothetical protein H6Q74_3230 [Firmicutes bacterium]|nr:hypothetical protein [Bacillota bacterium]
MRQEKVKLNDESDIFGFGDGCGYVYSTDGTAGNIEKCEAAALPKSVYDLYSVCGLGGAYFSWRDYVNRQWSYGGRDYWVFDGNIIGLVGNKSYFRDSRRYIGRIFSECAILIG